MSPGAANLYVYYRVRPADAPQLIAAAQALQSRLRADMPGLVCSLSQRAIDDAKGPTFMEIYSHAEGFDAQSQQLLEAGAERALSEWIVGDRHIERFVPCA